MNLRISLIVVLLTGLAAIATTHLALRPKIARLMEVRDQLKTERDQQTARAGKLAVMYKEVSQTVVHNEAQLKAVTAQLATAQAESALLRERNTLVSQSLDEANNYLTAARQQLAQLAVLGLTPEQAAGLFKSNQVLVSRIASLESEKDKLTSDYRNLKKQWDLVNSGPEIPELPPVSGKVVAWIQSGILSCWIWAPSMVLCRKVC